MLFFVRMCNLSHIIIYYNIGRVIFALGGEEYEDIRYAIDPATFQSTEFLEAKNNGDLKMNLNRAPILILPDGKVIGQSKAIERYLAKRYGFMGAASPENEVC